jgi:hypothetical protein
MKIWSCKIGEVDPDLVPKGGDGPMRKAVEKAYKELTGEYAAFCFSGWGAQLDEIERAAYENREPAEWHWEQYFKELAAVSMYEAFHDIINLIEERGEDDPTLTDIADIAESMIIEATPPQPTKEN